MGREGQGVEQVSKISTGKNHPADESAPSSAATSYDEMYKGRFHFSLRSGWMNDINGLWHSGGLYSELVSMSFHKISRIWK